jgi:tetratricopeptide (TPR) repeat protein
MGFVRSPHASGFFELLMWLSRRLVLSLLSLFGILALVGSALAVVGEVRWGDPRWYYRTSPEFRLRRGQDLLRKCDTGRAEQIALLLEAGGCPDQAHLLRGEALFRRAEPSSTRGDLPTAGPLLLQALEELNQIRDQGELRLEAATLIGRCALALNQPREAERALSFVLSERPDDLEAHRALGALYYDQGATSRAVQHLERVGELDPRDGRPFRFLGLIFKDQQLYEQATSYYEEALRRELHGRVPGEVRQELAECLVKQRQYARAEELLRQVDPLPEDAAAVTALRAESLWGLHRTAEAQALLDETLATQQTCGDLYRLRAQLYLEAKDPAAAVPPLERALALDRHDFTSRYQLVLAYERLGRRAEAAVQQRLLQATRQDLELMGRLTEEASRHPWDADVRLRLAALCDKFDRPRDAAVWRRAAAACPARSDTPPKQSP